MTSPDGWYAVRPPSVPGTSSLRRRMFANVPRTITSWLPRRAPYELNSRCTTPCSSSQRPAGPSGWITPAGEMWSVVIESPSTASARMPLMSVRSRGSAAMPEKNGGWRTYVESASQSIVWPVGATRARQCSSPSQIAPYSFS